MKDTVRQFVLRAIAKKAGLPKDGDIDALNYIDSGYVDSIGIIKFVVEIESEFDVEITEDDMESPDFRTVGGLVSIIERKRDSQNRAAGNAHDVLGIQQDVLPEVRLLAEAFVSPASAGRRYLFGRNDHSLALAETIDIDGFVDDFASTTVWHGKPVVKGERVPGDAIVVNCVLMARSLMALRRAKTLNVRGVLDYGELLRVFPERVPTPTFVKDTKSDFQENQRRWDVLKDALADDESRRVLTDVLKFRLTADTRCLARYSFRPEEQYFEDFLSLAPGEVFVDAGGYDGDTTKEFIRRCPGYSEVLFFEPSAKNIEAARQRLNALRSIKYIEKGLSDAVGTLSFNAGAGSASAVSETGGVLIPVTTLDVEAQDRVSFIKMDLEGWELKALAGARRHILKDHPKLAIAVYHHPSDFWKTFGFVMGLRSDYSVYLRHYTEGWTETIMFFVPRPPV